jgi:chloramphenicol 3-O phosphotransferase
MARAGARIIVDEVFLGGAASQQRWKNPLAEVVHQGITYDLQVDTTHTEALDCARQIAACVQ